MKRVERSESVSIVADGRERAIAGASPELAERYASVETAIKEKFAMRLQQGGVLRRFWLRLQMSIEIRRRVRREKEKIAPTAALYATAPEAKTDG